MKKPVLEEMICHKYKGILCKICEADRFGKLFRVAHGTQKTKYGCHKCIISILENEIKNDSDNNKAIQDMINYINS